MHLARVSGTPGAQKLWSSWPGRSCRRGLRDGCDELHYIGCHHCLLARRTDEASHPLLWIRNPQTATSLSDRDLDTEDLRGTLSWALLRDHRLVPPNRCIFSGCAGRIDRSWRVQPRTRIPLGRLPTHVHRPFPALSTPCLNSQGRRLRRAPHS